MKHFLIFINRYALGIPHLEQLQLSLPTDNDGFITDPSLVPKDALTYEVMDKFASYLCTNATYGNGTHYSPGSCQNYFSAVKSYYVDEHPTYKTHSIPAPGFNDTRWAK